MKIRAGMLVATLFALCWSGGALAQRPFVPRQPFGPPAFGPPEWPQYRLNARNNAVFNDGAAALPDHHFKTSGEVRATPVIVGDHLYIGNHLTGGLFAFDVRSGKKLWGDDNPDWRHAPNWVHSDMVYADGRIFVSYGNRVFASAHVRGTGASGVMAIDPHTGATLWDYATRGEVMPTPAYWHGEVLAATGAGRLLALDAATGKVAWSLALTGWVSMSSPAVWHDTLFVGARNAVVAVDLDTRRKLWEYDETGSFTDVSPAVSASGVVVITAAKYHEDMTAAEKRRWPHARQYVQFAYGFNARTGKLLWQTLMGYGPAQADNTSGAPAIADGRIYVGSPYTDSFFCLDVATGKQLWEYNVNAAIKGAPAIADGLVFFGDTQGFLHVLDAATGRRPQDRNGMRVHKLKLGGSLSAAKTVALAPGGPVIINQNLFVGSQDDFVYSVSIPHWLGTAMPHARAKAAVRQH